MSEYEYVFYIYERNEDDPRFSFWILTPDGGGMSLYERLPDGEGMWLKPSQDGGYDSTDPTDDLRDVVAGLMGDGVDGEKVAELPPHERHFVSVLHGTAEQNADAIPGPVWEWMHDCSEVRGE